VALLAFLTLLLMVGLMLKSARRRQIRQAYQRETTRPPLAGTGTPASADEPPTRVASAGCVVDVTVDHTRTSLMLAAQSTVLGRGQQLALPNQLRERLAQDPYLARVHCELWYRQDGNFLYLRCLSDNGLQLNGRAVAGGEKVKTEFAGPVTLTLGHTNLILTRRGLWP